jgi:hypothetical protein
MRSLILIPLAFFLLSGSQPPVGCRVNPATVEWTEERTLPAYTGTEPLTTIHLDLCCFVSRTLQYENLGYILQIEGELRQKLKLKSLEQALTTLSKKLKTKIVIQPILAYPF